MSSSPLTQSSSNDIHKTADEPRKCLAFPVLAGSQSMNTGSEISLNQTKEWMQMCQTHPHCSREHDSVLPTRVLDIGDRSVKAIPQSSEVFIYIGKLT
jgi:hypothetical protein